MFFSENIYFLILFTLPAAFNIIYRAYIRYTPVTEDNKSVELAGSVLFCFAVFLFNILINHTQIQLFMQYNILEGKELESFIKQTNFDYYNFIKDYFILNIFSSVIVIFLWYKYGLDIFRRIMNILNKQSDRPEELLFPDCWNNIFETKRFLDSGCRIVEIERAGRQVVAGRIGLRSGPTTKNRELVLRDTDFIEKQLEEDKNLEPDQKMFGEKLFEYYDFQRDVLIKFYNSNKYEELHVERPYQQNCYRCLNFRQR